MTLDTIIFWYEPSNYTSSHTTLYSGYTILTTWYVGRQHEPRYQQRNKNTFTLGFLDIRRFELIELLLRWHFRWWFVWSNIDNHFRLLYNLWIKIQPFRHKNSKYEVQQTRSFTEYICACVYCVILTPSTKYPHPLCCSLITRDYLYFSSLVFVN